MAIGTMLNVIRCSLMIVGCIIQPQNVVSLETDVKSFGAVGDGITDNSLAVNKAWDAACSSTGQFKLSAGNFVVQPLSFSGPCKAPTVVVTVEGTLLAPPKNKWINNTDTWLNFQHIDNLVITGPGRFDGQGQSGWWDSCKQTSTCENNPTALGFHHCNGLHLTSVTSINSPKNHISINACNGAIISNISITAPKESPNTDGIDISDSNGVHVTGGHIGTGTNFLYIAQTDPITTKPPPWPVEASLRPQRGPSALFTGEEEPARITIFPPVFISFRPSSSFQSFFLTPPSILATATSGGTTADLLLPPFQSNGDRIGNKVHISGLFGVGLRWFYGGRWWFPVRKKVMAMVEQG
ncbi:unnamed protein product [Lactuca virosa]|uniref:Polygalacturonase n=1 Tax=Lactuca virosa TaxID=75947 RepID=A0AAU9LZ15_9ASTR|nr:unnamed protein product [Lactuca virosa]